MCVAASLALGCGSTPPQPKAPASQAQPDPQALATALPEEPPLAPPKVEQRFGALKREQRAPLALLASAMEATRDGVYLEVPLDSALDGGDGLFPEQAALCGELTADGRSVQIVEGRLGAQGRRSPRVPPLPTPRGQGSQPDGERAPALYVRFAGPEAPPAKSQLRLLACRGGVSDLERRSTQRGAEREVTLDLSAAPPMRSGVAARFLEQQAEWFLDWGRLEKQSHFGTFSAGRMARASRALQPGKRRTHEEAEAFPWLAPYERGQFGADSTELTDLMDFYTGHSQVVAGMAVRLGLGPLKPGQATVALDTLEGVDAPTRDYAALVRALRDSTATKPQRARADTPTSKLDPLSRHLPSDAIVIGFASLQDFITVGRTLDRRLSALAQTAEEMPGPQWLMERYRRQLALDLDGLAEKLGQVAVGSVAVALSDPYLREGSDLAIVLEARNQGLLSAVLEAHVQRAAAAHPGLRRNTLELSGHPVALVETPDGGVRRYQVELPGVTVLTNSPGAMRRMLAVGDGKAPSLAASPDYHYARTVKPYLGARESAFLFLGDGLMTRITGPRSKILEARRVRTQVELQAVDWAALLYGWMQGHPPASKAELLDSPWLASSDLAHSDGSAIDWTPEAGASSRWGSAYHLRPIIDHDLERVTEAERDAYTEFKRSYEWGRRGGIDPTLVRVLLSDSGKRLETEVTVLPIDRLSNSFNDYERMTRMAGVAAVEMPPLDGGLSFTLAIGEDSQLKREAERALRIFGGGEDFGLGFVGQWLQAGVDDRAVIWDLALSTLLRDHASPPVSAASASEAPSTDAGQARLPEPEELVGHLPLWIALHVKNKLSLAAALTTLRAMVDEAAPGIASWNKSAPYRDIETTRIDIEEEDTPMSIHYCIVKDVGLVSLQRDTLERQIDRVLAGRIPQGASTPGPGYQLWTSAEPHPEGVFRRLAALLLDLGAQHSHWGAVRGFEILERGFGHAALDPKRSRELALRTLGYEPRSPQGGTLVWNAEGLVAHEAYGTALEPSIPDARDPSLDIHQALAHLLSLVASVKLEDRGGERELHGRSVMVFAE